MKKKRQCWWGGDWEPVMWLFIHARISILHTIPTSLGLAGKKVVHPYILPFLHLSSAKERIRLFLIFFHFSEVIESAPSPLLFPRRTNGGKKERPILLHPFPRTFNLWETMCCYTIRSTFRRNITSPRVAIFDFFLHGLIAMLREKRRRKEEEKKKDSHVLTRPPFIPPICATTTIFFWEPAGGILVWKSPTFGYIFCKKNSSRIIQPKYTGLSY